MIIKYRYITTVDTTDGLQEVQMDVIKEIDKVEWSEELGLVLLYAKGKKDFDTFKAKEITDAVVYGDSLEFCLYVLGGENE